MNRSVITTDIAEVLGKGLDISEKIREDALFFPLERKLKDAGIVDIAQKIDQYRAYMELLLETNEKLNLTAITDPKEFMEKHYLDSLQILDIKEYVESESILDLGTGGGFPGVPLAIASPDKDFLLVDSVEKKLRAVENMVEECHIHNISIEVGRAEELAREKEHRDRYDMAVSRAVADLPVLCEYCLPFIKEGGSFISYKSADCEEEVERAENAIRELGGRLNRVENRGEHALVIIDKIAGTPDRYPRRTGIPAKRPL